MAKSKRNKAKNIKPDDHFAAGPIEFARFGRLVIGRSRATREEYDAIQARLAAQYPIIVSDIDDLVASIAAQIARLPPDRLLQRGWWEYSTMMVGIGGKDASDSEKLLAARMVDYVQSMIVSVKPEQYAADVGEEDWTALKADIEGLFRRLTLDYQMCMTAHRKAQDAQLDMQLEEFRFRAETLWLNIRGKRYQLHERQALLDVLAPHSEILLKLFGLDADDLAAEFDKILTRLTHGLIDIAEEIKELHAKSIVRLDELAAKRQVADFEELMNELFEDHDLAAQRDRFAGAMIGFDLFDVGKNTNLPKVLLDALSYSPGEDTEFFAPGEFAGWPLRIWPIMRRPFVRLNGSTHCFDFFSLFDNIYRVLRRIVVELDPTYKEAWNIGQKAISEELPFTYLKRLMPGARAYRPVYYRWKVGSGPAQWHEADGILIYEDHLFIIEVKGGAFTYTSPANDLNAHLESLRALLQAPARQGSRFVDFLESAPEVSIADAEHNEIAKLRRSDFRHVTVCTITLDAFTALAARAQHLAPLGINVGQRPLWPLSIDDLRVYADLFDNPLIFLHFVEMRVRAGHSEKVDLNDEMDHFGMYITENNYTQYAEELSKNAEKMQFDGYTTVVDEYFSGVLVGDAPPKPRQKMPYRVAEILDLLATSDELHRAELSSFILDGAGDWRDNFASSIENALKENKELKRARPLSWYGEMETTLFVWSLDAPRNIEGALEHTRVVMLADDKTERRLIELEYDKNAKLFGAHLRNVTLFGLSTAEIERLRAQGGALQRKRIAGAQAKKKIGRNDKCPCGSGKKWKKCHGREA
ncbi:YecA family protein [Pleomorphomonas oryzae]|uniref:YecA family protein n=1 Tax=Pleomorphomonas oryzae TaxID=261934 RepID=UPI0004283DC0|nr:SEC-C metal-binding domain-containing protein [Pleomorphomonas oryzae]